jgi:hypothetical protein
MPRMPSPEELRTSSLAWFERVGPTLIDRWPAELMALSIPTAMVECPVKPMIDLFDHTGEEPPLGIRQLASALDDVIGWQRRFPRLNSRSPKDATWPFEALSVLSGKDVISTFRCSERILDDLCRFSHIPEHPAYICLRDWVWGWRSAREYRCFVKDGKLIAVTHYDYTNPWQGPEDGGRALRKKIDEWFSNTLRHTLPVDTIVFDLYLNHDDSFLLIEINPYGLSDPCWLGNYAKVENASSYIEFAPNPDLRIDTEAGG